MKLRDCNYRFLLLATVLFAFAYPSHAQTALGSVQGTVVDADNSPVAGATVYPVSGPASTGTAHGSVTDQDGHFQIVQLAPGTYQLSAFKLHDGYADTAQSFYQQPNHPLTTVTVASATENADLSIQLGARCGILHIEVNDAVTHRPITSAALTLGQRNGSGAVMEGEKSFPGDFLVPPVDIAVAIHTSGYAAWHIADDGRDYITIRPGEHRTLHADLQPVAAK